MEFILLVLKVLGMLAIIIAIETFPAYLGRKRDEGRKIDERNGSNEGEKAAISETAKTA